MSGTIKTLGLMILLALLSARSAVAQEEKKRSDGEYSIFRRPPDLQEIREEITRWDQSVRGFRKDHHFTLVAGTMNGIWHFKRFGNQINKKYEDSGFISKFHYTYHLAIYKSFGYYLGSSAGAWTSSEGSKKVGIQSATMLPGILAGFCLNVTPGFRMQTGIDYYLERWSRLQERDQEREDPKISVTARSTDLLVAFDVFYRLKWAFRFEAHQRTVDYKAPKRASGKDTDASISRRDQWLGAGLVYHLM